MANSTGIAERFNSTRYGRGGRHCLDGDRWRIALRELQGVVDSERTTSLTISMRFASAALVVAGLCAAAVAEEPQGLVRSGLVSDYQPGAGTFTIGVHLPIRSGWHVYRKYPGDAGLATSVRWSVPEGFSVSELVWPVPTRFVQAGEIEGIGYETMKTLAERYNGKVVWLAINSTGSATPQQNARWISRYSLPYPILSDTDGKVGKAYGAKTTPHMFIVDQKGALVYQGGIDHDRSGANGNRTNYVAKALDEILPGQSVSEPETRPYGCSVKYK